MHGKTSGGQGEIKFLKRSQLQLESSIFKFSKETLEKNATKESWSGSCNVTFSIVNRLPFFPAIFWKLFEFGFSIIVSWKIKWSVLMEMDSWHKNFKCEDSNFTSLAKCIEMAGLLWNSMSTFLNQIESFDLIRIIDIWRLLGSDCMLESCIVLKN